MNVRACLVAALVGSAPSAVAAQDVALPTVLEKAGAYVKAFTLRFSNVVSEEKYEQDWDSERPLSGVGNPRGGTIANIAGAPSVARRRILRSDFLLVKPSPQADWMPFRDVFEVDGSAVRDREQRLEQLFLKPTGGSVSRAQAIANESSRYNLGNMERTVNNPVLSLAFLQPEHQPRFVFKLDKRDKGAGANVWIVEYKEVVAPTLVTGRFGRSLPSRGRFWIDADTGDVLRSELILNDTSIAAKLTTSFKRDERFGISVPVELREQYSLAGNTKVTGLATYGRFRHFGVTSETNIETPSPESEAPERVPASPTDSVPTTPTVTRP